MAVRNWTNLSGGLWSVQGNWALSAPPTSGTNDAINFASGTYTSTIDTAFLSGITSPSFGDITLHSGLTLDVQRSITVAQIDGGLSADGSPSSGGNAGGLIEIGKGAVLTYNPAGGSLVNTTNGQPGVGLYFKGDGIGAIGTISVGGAIDTGGTVIADAVNFDASGGIIDTTAVLTLKNGAAWNAQAGETFGVGTVKLAGGGEANFGGLLAGALSLSGFPGDQHAVVMSGSADELVVPNTADGESLTLTGFDLTDKVEIAGLTSVQSATYDATKHLNFFSGLNGTGTLLASLTDVSLAAGLPSSLPSNAFFIGSDTTGTFVELVSCFTPGSRILTSKGETKVEDLREGDLVMTARDDASEPRPVIWIGRRTLDLTRHPYPWMATPIRVRRGAVAENVPHRDLVLSPDHAIFIDGGLVPVRLLVNGASIVRESCETVTYFHIECESHTIILAEGLAVETYLDTGNRGMFDNAPTPLVLHPSFHVDAAAKCWDDACAPLRTAAAIVEPIWRRLAERSANLGFPVSDAPATTDEAQVRLLANGRELCPVSVKNGRLIFVLPSDVAEVTLLSRTTCPAMERPWLEDQRQLGVAVRDMVFRGNGDCGNGDFHVASADDPGLTRGWWPVERDDTRHWRWTDGAGVIGLPFATRVVEIEIAITTRYAVNPAAWRDSLAA